MTTASTRLKIVVTGGSGRIGREVVKQLAARGHEVWNMDLRQSADRTARFIYADLRQREQVQPIFEQVDAVCHFGEIPHPFGRSPDEVYYNNARGGSVVLQSAADVGVKRVIYCSSCQVYGVWSSELEYIAPRFLPMDETHPLLPQNAYALSKASNERFAQLMARDCGLSVAAFRLPWVIGHSGDGHHPRLLHAIENPNDEPREGMHTYIHSSDVARACALAVENPRPGFEAYHFTAAEVASARPIREVLIKQWPDLPPLPADWPKYKSPVIMEKARQHFGWEPQFNLMDLYRQKHGRDPQ